MRTPGSQNRAFRFAVDTGGTFTDLLIEGESGGLRFYKRPTTPEEPVIGVLNALSAAASDFGVPSNELLARGELFILGTTRATNAVVTRSTAKTALIVTKGHPDILLFREGGDRATLFDYTQEYPDPYIPRSLTFEVLERLGPRGEVLVPLGEDAVEVIEELQTRGVEAVAVSLLWSIVNPVHELKIGDLLEKHLPGVPFTLSHRLNPSLREYRRTSSAAFDASLKPLMSRFFRDLEDGLRQAGFRGRLLIMTSAGGVLDASAVAEAPIHSIGSGPAAAPVAGRYFARLDADSETAIVTDAGGTTYDVSLVRRGEIPRTRETKVGHPVHGYMTGFPSVDVRSIGAGGGSIAWVDRGGLLHIGPHSAGAIPGPASYGRGGSRATVTDACVVLGYIDPDYFLDGEMKLFPEIATKAIDHDVGRPLGLAVEEAAAAVLDLTVEHMARAIEEITLSQGIDPAEALVIGGGGAAGLYAVAIARRLGSQRVIIPEVAAALSASGALLSDLQTEYTVNEVTSTSDFNFERANGALTSLRARAEEFTTGPGGSSISSRISYSVEARYPHQVWEIEVPLRAGGFATTQQVEELRQDFHRVHEELFAISDPASPVELVAWRAHVRCTLRRVKLTTRTGADWNRPVLSRNAYFAGHGWRETVVRHLKELEVGERQAGPVIVESRMTTVVVGPSATASRLPSGSLMILPWADGEGQAGGGALVAQSEIYP